MSVPTTVEKMEQELVSLHTASRRIKELTAELARVTAERDAALRWQELAFQAHPNIDLDIEAIAAREG